MKKLFIPKGETRYYESLETEHIIVKGCLKVETTIKCRHITGDGVIEAGLISADTVTASDLEASEIISRKLLAQRVCACEIHVAESMAVSCCLKAQLVEAGKLTVAMSEIGELRCGEVVNLPVKRRSLLGTLAASFLRSVWTALTCPIPKELVMDADWKPAEDSQAAPTSEQAVPQEQAATGRFSDLENDFEFLRLAGLYRLLKPQGFYLRLVPVEEPGASGEEHPAEPLDTDAGVAFPAA